VQEAFRTAIHKYLVNGEEHWANSNEPSIPTALAPAVQGVLTLHNFPRHPQFTLRGVPVHDPQGPPVPLPLFTFTSDKETYYGLGPTDFATIYNVLPLWNAGVDGTGQTIAIVGETNIHLTDIEAFRSLFGLPAKDPQIILNGPDPGMTGDEPEAVLDVSWSGAVAKNATVDLVVSATTEASLGVDLSALYIVDNNLAPVMSESYGECEATLGNAGNAFYNALWQQAAAQGITVVIAAGDSGSAGCDDFDTESTASDGLAVSGFASTPYNVAVGGTDFDQTAATAPKYWSATNNATTGASALGYIPETTWNLSCAGLGFGNCPTSSTELDIVGGSGGPSSCSATDSNGKCLTGYSKPAWQTGTGVPQDGVRDLPDVSLFASSGFNGSFYILCEADMGLFGTSETCSLTTNTFVGIGGTSASAPTFAAMMALVNQKTAARQGNANYILYKLAAQNGASCNSSTAAATGNSCIFYDITKGNDSVPCASGTLNCGTLPAGDSGYGLLIDSKGSPAWTTTAGYDLATGLGSVNAFNLVNAWSATAFTPSTTTLTNVSPVSIVHGQAVNVSATVAAKSGGSTPTGSVALMATPSGNSVGINDFPLVNGAASGTTTLLPGGTYNVTAHYPGDGSFAASDSAPVQVTVGKENSQTTATLVAYNSTSQTYYQTNTVPYGSVFFLRSDVTNMTGTACAPNPAQSGVACPTGSVSFTTNAVSDGSYAINSQGYVENQTISPNFGTVGNYTLGAQYSGDNSYNPSSAVLNATVTQAPTSMYMEINDLPYYNGGGANYLAWSGQLFHVFAPVLEQSILLAPTGTVTFLENGNPPSGAVVLYTRNGSGSLDPASHGYLDGTLATSIDTPGTYTFTASYAGDAHYLGSQSPYSLSVLVVDTTFNITPPILNVTIAAPGQTGTTTITLAGVDNFAGTVNVTCALPATMTESTCPAVTANLGNNTTATAQLTITTTAAHPLTASRTGGKGLYGFAVLAGVFLLVLPGSRRRRFPLALLLLVCFAGFAGCGSGSSSGGGGGTSTQTDPGTPAGTYTVNVTATSIGITRTASFSVTVQ
jgi:subtilase family serine protease